MAIVKLILDWKEPSWVVGNTDVLDEDEIVHLTDGRFARGDGTTEVQNLTFFGGISNSESHMIAGGGITVVTDDITVAEATYYISGFGNFTSPETAFNNISLSSSGTQRFVAFYGKTDSTVVKVEGTEGAVASMPSGPANSILVNYSLVTDGSIGSGVDLSGYLPRADKATAAEVVTGTNDTKYVTALAVAGKASKTGTETLTNKRVTKRRVVVTQSATPTINTDNTDIASITGLAQAITSFTTNLSGTPVAGDMMMIQITDNGTARTITWGASFQSTSGAVLPTTTVISTMLRVLFQWNAAASKWDCIGVC